MSKGMALDLVAVIASFLTAHATLRLQAQPLPLSNSASSSDDVERSHRGLSRLLRGRDRDLSLNLSYTT